MKLATQRFGQSVGRTEPHVPITAFDRRHIWLRDDAYQLRKVELAKSGGLSRDFQCGSKSDRHFVGLLLTVRGTRLFCGHSSFRRLGHSWSRKVWCSINLAATLYQQLIEITITLAPMQPPLNRTDDLTSRISNFSRRISSNQTL
jgi:hypothetical protein